MHLTTYLHLLQTAETVLAGSYRTIADGHPDDPDVHYTCLRFADDCAARADMLRPTLTRYDDASEPEPERLHPAEVSAARSGPVGLLRDLQELSQLAGLVQSTCMLVGQAAHGARDRELIDLTAAGEHDVTAQLAWLRAACAPRRPRRCSSQTDHTAPAATCRYGR